jgi:hypothetical protein
MKNLNAVFFGIFSLISFLSSCQQDGCTVKNQAGQIALDRNCNGIPDFDEGVGNITFYGEGLVTNVPTNIIGYYNNGGYAQPPLGDALGTGASTQHRLISIKILVNGVFVVRQAIVDKDVANDMAMATAELFFTNKVVDIFDAKNVTVMQQYLNNDEKVVVPILAAIPESTPVFQSLGSNTCNPTTYVLNGRPIHYEVIGWETKYVRDVFGIVQ